MRTLNLSNSEKLAIVDDDDFYRFRGFNWQLKAAVNYPWFSTIQIPKSKPRRQKYLGSFKTREEAAMAFVRASKEIHGEFSPYKDVEVIDAV